MWCWRWMSVIFQTFRPFLLSPIFLSYSYPVLFSLSQALLPTLCSSFSHWSSTTRPFKSFLPSLEPSRVRLIVGSSFSSPSCQEVTRLKLGIVHWFSFDMWQVLILLHWRCLWNLLFLNEIFFQWPVQGSHLCLGDWSWPGLWIQ